jgi:hypothetical protein
LFAVSTELDVYKEWLGIPEGPRPPDHYALLRLVQFEDTPDKIRANYKKLNAHVRKYATGQYGVRSQTLLNELAKAMLCLTDVERKREYDLEQGRTFDAELPGGRKLMETTLVEQKHISVGQLKEAKEYADKAGLELRDALVQLKMVDQSVAAQALASERGIPYVDLADMLPDDDVLDQMPKATVKQHSILPLFIDEDVLLVASVDLIQHEVEEELRLRFNLPVRTVMTTPLAITQGIAKYYAPGARNESVLKGGKATSGKGGGKAAAPSKAATKAPPRRGKVTEEEKKQQKSIGIIIICWSVIASYLIDNFALTPGAFFDMYTFLIYGTLVPIAAVVAWFGFMGGK